MPRLRRPHRDDQRGFLRLQREVLAQARGELEPLQRYLLVELLSDCAWERGEVLVEATRERIELDVGEALFASRSFAERCGVSRDQVRRFRERLERLGWVAARPARAAPPPAPPPAPRPAPPPTVIRVLAWRAFLWPATQAAPPPAPRPAPPPAPDQEGQRDLFKKEGGEASLPPRSEGGRAVAAAFADLYLHERGAIYARPRPRDRSVDAAAAEQLAAAFGNDVDEIRERARRGLRSRGYRVDGVPQVNTLVELARFCGELGPTPEEAAARAEARRREERERENEELVRSLEEERRAAALQ